MSKRILVISDCQCKPTESLDYVKAFGRYIVDKKPDVIVNIGDWYDLPSLSSYDKGTKAFEGRRLKEDIDAGNKGMELLLSPLRELQARQKENKKKVYKPRLVFTVGNHECLTPETDVLTKDGYKNITEITVEDEVLTLCDDGVTCEWNKPSKFIAKTHKGEIHHYRSRSFSLSCTPNHRIYYKQKDKLFVKESKDMPANFSVPSAGVISNVGVNLSDEQIQLAAWLSTDSHYTKGNSVVLYQRTSKSHLIRDLLDGLGLSYTEKVRVRDIKEVCGRVLLKAPEPSHEFTFSKSVSDGLCVYNNTSLPSWCADLTKQQWDLFLKTLVEADGTIPTKASKSLVFYGKKPICDDVQMYATMFGWSASLTEYRENQWRVNLCDRAVRRQEDLVKVVENYDGMVYCLEVKNSNFMIRHNNKAHFTGNCRYDRFVNSNPEWEGMAGVASLGLEKMGWEVVPFLKPIEIEGFYFVHYLTNPFTGKVLGGTVLNQLKTVGKSFVVGHKQVLDIAIRPILGGKQQLGIISGAAYPFDEHYKGEQLGNSHFRGLVMLNEVKDGYALPCPVSTEYLMRKYL